MKSENFMLLSRAHLLFINQLWNKHSVITAENLRLSNPTAEKIFTVLTTTGFLEASERILSIFRDKYSEQLAYPGIFLGQKRPENDGRLVDVHYSDICKSKRSKFQQI